MSSSPLISICIPAYKNVVYLERLFQSIQSQTFQDYEVVVTDDSPDDAVGKLIDQYRPSLPISYYRNATPLGSPANWNAAIAHATGRWIKIMHDDDWFADEHSLAVFANATMQTKAVFIFSGFVNVQLETGEQQSFVLSSSQEQMLRRNPLYLFRTNYVGHPSTTLIKNELKQWFDESIKWVVDFEFYIRVLREHSFYAVKQPLIHIGIGSEQITKASFRKREVELPENFYLLHKLGAQALSYFFVYDYYWRLMRNLKIKTTVELEEYVQLHHVPAVIKSMISWQQKLGVDALKKYGAYSKICMSIHYALHSPGKKQ
ncbi:glycosyltransferase family 2 protein [Lacibacter luteus]|uniref:Glycosyltransferase family 2 protein n=1 Tax=Lacibacter luteus TaxID=2508719 RepID=A0A4Q1CMI4_9BACT|nr:glycosyltransferase family 2 protein [Lacibacter luteus]RXK62230.1 glycosyltransferase family 2 protein [Lacibacter luteus]